MAGISNDLFVMLQQDFLHYKEYTTEKLLIMEEKMDMFMSSMSSLVKEKWPEGDFQNPFGSPQELMTGGPRMKRGLFKNPQDAERRRLELNVPPGSGAEEKEEEELRHLKIQFPRFNEGDEAKSWIADCNEYFKVYGVYSRRRIAIAAMHVHETAKGWYKAYMIGKPELTWEQFSADFISRFTEAGVEDIFEQFKLLKQEGNVNDYYDKFEKHKGWLMEEIPGLTEGFFVGSFVGGLKEELKRVVKLFDPQTVIVAYKQAKHCEGTVSKVIPVTTKPISMFSSRKEEMNAKVTNAPMLVYPKTKIAVLEAPRRLTASQRDERRNRGLCFYFDEKYVVGHQCSKPKAFMMVSEDEYEGPPIFDEEPNTEKGDVDPEMGERIEISLNAMEGQSSHKTIMLKGSVGKKHFSILVDGGSTHNFIDAKLAKRLGVVLEDSSPLRIAIAGGGQLWSSQQCTELSWKMAHHYFKDSFKVLNLGGCDMV